jgi:DNA-binding winged helix-turn-helix (wHTH) protein/Flp pilus assembly protein TadD/TolB-like protein
MPLLYTTLAMTEPLLRSYKFKNFLINLTDETLLQNGKTLHLSRRAFQVLLLLVENAGQIIRKEDFFNKIWEGNAVEENNLTVTIARIRKILGETKEDKFIETVPLKGYRFVTEVEKIYEENNKKEKIYEESNKKEEFGKSGSFEFLRSRKVLVGLILALACLSLSAFWLKNYVPRKTEPLQSIAVLPFSIDRKTPDSELFAEKLTQELITNLGRISDTRVSGYNAVSLYSPADIDPAQIRKDLQVDGIIIGKIKNTGEAGNLEVAINDLRTDSTVFTAQYSLKAQDLSESQYRVARDLARAIGKNKPVQGTAATTNLEAYQSYLLARHHLSKTSYRDHEKAIQHFSDAVVKDNKFADAYAGLATAYIKHGLAIYGARGLSASHRSFPLAKESALRSLELNPDSDEALTALGFVQYRHEYDWKNAEENFKRAVSLNPNNSRALRWLGEFLHYQGRFDEGFIEQQKALQLEPNSALILSEISWGNYLARRFDEAEKYAQKSQYIDKTHASTLYNLSEIYEQKGNYGEAVLLWKEAMTLESAARKWIADLEMAYQRNGHKGFVKGKAEWLEDLVDKDYVYPTDLAKCYAVLGDKDKAFEWLKKAVESRAPDILSIKHTPAFENLRDEDQYKNLLKKLNLS